MHEVDAAELLEELGRGTAVERFARTTGGLVIARVGIGDPEPGAELVESFASLPFILIAVGPGCGVNAQGARARAGWQDLADIALDEDESVDDIASTVTGCPRASVALAMLLRGHERRTIGDGLVAESAVYSMLQAGPEYEAWRTGHPIRARTNDDGPRVRVDRADDRLTITLIRSRVRNAFDARMRDELLDALQVAVFDPSIARTVLRGEGAVFCSGGDLDEFGSRPDPATAHVVRLHRNVGRVILALGGRIEVHVHGPCAGSGVEMAAFASQVIATRDATFALPEISLGLIPGAGGTVSLPARVGRHRTAWLALSGRAVDAPTAERWQLVDEIVDE